MQSEDKLYYVSTNGFKLRFAKKHIFKIKHKYVIGRDNKKM